MFVRKERNKEEVYIVSLCTQCMLSQSLSYDSTLLMKWLEVQQRAKQHLMQWVLSWQEVLPSGTSQTQACEITWSIERLLFHTGGHRSLRSEATENPGLPKSYMKGSSFTVTSNHVGELSSGSGDAETFATICGVSGWSAKDSLAQPPCPQELVIQIFCYEKGQALRDVRHQQSLLMTTGHF